MMTWFPQPPIVLGDRLDDERATLGLLVAGADVWDDRLSPEVFFADQHRQTFVAVRSLRDAGQPINVLSVSRAMSSHDDELACIGAEVNRVAESMGILDHFGFHVSRVVEDWRRRKAAQRAAEYVERLNDPTVDVDSLDREFDVRGFVPPARPID